MSNINEKLIFLQETKDVIRNAIADKGVQIPNEATFREYENYIKAIPSLGNGSELWSIHDANTLTIYQCDSPVINQSTLEVR